jgi:hypothetical protein
MSISGGSGSSDDRFHFQSWLVFEKASTNILGSLYFCRICSIKPLSFGSVKSASFSRMYATRKIPSLRLESR